MGIMGRQNVSRAANALYLAGRTFGKHAHVSLLFAVSC
jgi:hypothetical protein